MASLYRLALWLVFAALWLVAGADAHADGTVPKVSAKYGFDSLLGTGICSDLRVGGNVYSTPSAACSTYSPKHMTCAMRQNPNTTLAATSATVPTGTTTCHEVYNATTNGQTTTGLTSDLPLDVTPAACPVNSTPNADGTTCTCGVGYVSNGTSCVSPQTGTCQLAQQKGLTEWMSAAGKVTLGTTTCMNMNCQGVWTSAVSYTNKVTGITESEGTVGYTGAECTYNPSAGDTTSSYPDECKGGFYGQVNGINTCVPYDPNRNVVESTKATNQTVTGTVSPSTPGGTGTTSTGTTTTTTTEGTKCDGGQCTTTQNGTKANADGTTTTFTTTTTMTMSDYCKDHPTEELCKAVDKGSFTGSCSAGFSCSGDAVQCAQARAAYDLKCTLVDGPSGSSSVEKALYEASAGMTGTGIVTSAVALSSSSFDQSNALGVGGSCALDKTITVRGTVVTLPFSQVCSSLAMMGNILLAVGFLLAIRIVGRG